MPELYSEIRNLQALALDKDERCIITSMKLGDEHELKQSREELQAAHAELKELRQQIQSFEARVDARLGNLLDQLTAIRLEISSLNEALQQIREQRMFGKDRIRYLGAAPPILRPSRWEEPAQIETLHHQAVPSVDVASSEAQNSPLPDIKQLYRLLARRFHPDLARSDSERLALNDRMVEINQFYREENLIKLMDLAEMEVPFYLRINPPDKTEQHRKQLSELERVQLELREIQQQITRLSSLPVVQLSLDVKLSQLQGCDLLAEMAVDLKHKLDRKLAERDYLRAEVLASDDIDAD